MKSEEDVIGLELKWTWGRFKPSSDVEDLNLEQRYLKNEKFGVKK